MPRARAVAVVVTVLLALAGCGFTSDGNRAVADRDVVIVTANAGGAVTLDRQAGLLFGYDEHGRSAWRKPVVDVGNVSCAATCATVFYADQVSSRPTALAVTPDGVATSLGRGAAVWGQSQERYLLARGSHLTFHNLGTEFVRDLPGPVQQHRSDAEATWLSGQVSPDTWWIARAAFPDLLDVLTLKAHGPVLCVIPGGAITAGENSQIVSATGRTFPLNTSLDFLSDCSSTKSARVLLHQTIESDTGPATSVEFSQDGQPLPVVDLPGAMSVTASPRCAFAVVPTGSLVRLDAAGELRDLGVKLVDAYAVGSTLYVIAEEISAPSLAAKTTDCGITDVVVLKQQ